MVQKKTSSSRRQPTPAKRKKTDKIDFLSIAAHQLRAPLTLMKGYLSMIREGEFGKIKDRKLGAALEVVSQSNDRLIRLVENLLDMARLEDGKFKLFREEAELAPLALEVMDELRPKAKAKGLRLELVMPKERLSAFIEKFMIRQVLINLVDNAIKYTERGGVTVSLEKAGKKIRCSVSDTGPGLLQKADLKKLFQKFARPADDPSGQSGFGLGLYICRLIIEAHGGKLRAELPRGGGLAIVFEI